MAIYPVSSETNALLMEIGKIGCDARALPIFEKKLSVLPIKITGIKSALANIIKQEMLSAKADAALHMLAVSCKVDKTDIILLGNPSIYENFIHKINRQDLPTLSVISKSLSEILNNIASPLRKQKKLDYSRPVIMGILNVTEDSFYDGGRHSDKDKAMKHIEQMIKNGAEIIDIGGESTRPGAEPVSLEREMERVIPIVEKAAKEFDTCISVDTYKAKVADEALKAGALMINDISALAFDPDMVKVVKQHNALLVLMHIKGTPGNMQKEPHYEDVIREIVEYFDERVQFALDAGISKENLIIDPGIGFGKRLRDNIEIIRHMKAFKKHGLPLMVGASRKSSIGMILGGTDRMDDRAFPVEDRLYGTLAMHMLAVNQGADIIRVHDVKEHSELLKVYNAVKS